jgi:hypothetical protein
MSPLSVSQSLLTSLHAMLRQVLPVAAAHPAVRLLPSEPLPLTPPFLRSESNRPFWHRALGVLFALIRAVWAGMWWISPAILFIALDTLLVLQFPAIGSLRCWQSQHSTHCSQSVFFRMCVCVCLRLPTLVRACRNLCVCGGQPMPVCVAPFVWLAGSSSISCTSAPSWRW